jgi:hypothetical protein
MRPYGSAFNVLCVVPSGPPSHPGGGGDAGVGADADRQRPRRHRRAGPGAGGRTGMADMYLALEAARSCVDAVAPDWVGGVHHGPMWAPKVLAAKSQSPSPPTGSWTWPASRSAAPPPGGPRTGAALTRRAGSALPPRYRRLHPRDPRRGATRRGRGRPPLVTLSRPDPPPPRPGPPACGCARRA